MRRSVIAVLALAACLALPASAGAANLQSTFDSDDEGWFVFQSPISQS